MGSHVRAQQFPDTGREDFLKNKNKNEIDKASFSSELCTGNSISKPRAPLVVCRRWFSGEDGAASGVTVYTWEVRDIRHCRDSSQGPEENETWKMSLGYCDILHLEQV